MKRTEPTGSRTGRAAGAARAGGRGRNATAPNPRCAIVGMSVSAGGLAVRARSVTRFFRDPPAWRVLDDRVIARLVEAKEENQPLRAWVPGCGTGEEAYSLAILLIERVQAARKACPIQIFASDIDDAALEVARAGVYPASIAPDVGAERLRRFFVQEQHTHRATRQLRESVVFARQNLLTDPPFFRMDLLCCRNVLTCLDSGVRERLLALLHFALQEDGSLFLGSAERIGEHDDLFEPISTKWRIYRRRGVTRRDKLQFPVVSTVQSGSTPAATTARPSILRIGFRVQQLLVGRHAPACVVIDRKGEVLYRSGPIQSYLAPPSRPAAPGLFTEARKELRSQLRDAVRRAIRERRAVRVTLRAARRGSAHLRVRLCVEPLTISHDDEGLLLVSFEEERSSSSPGSSRSRKDGFEKSVVRQLALELETARVEWRRTIGQLETANEQSAASNEEMLSANEELRAANEELQTSRQELQLLNQELSTVNAELEAKIEELGRTNEDLDNLLASTNLATIFLDPSFRVRRFTPSATRLFNVLPSDVGRPLTDIMQKFADPELLADAGMVFEQLGVVRKELQTDDGRWYMREALPYRTRDNRIGGVVITFSDAARDVLRESRVRADTIVDTMHEGLLVLDSALRIVAANRAFSDGIDVPPKAVKDAGLLEIDGGSWDIPELRAALEVVLREGAAVRDLEVRWVSRRDGQHTVLMQVRPLETVDGRPRLILLAIQDITERKRQEETLRESEAKIRAILEAAVDGIVTSDASGAITSWNTAAERIFGYDAAEVVGKNVRMLMPAPYCDQHDAYISRYLDTGVARIIGRDGREVVGRRKDGTTFPLDLAVSEFHDGKGPGFVGILRDITMRKLAEDEEHRHQAELARVLRVSLVGELGVGLAHEMSQPLAAIANTLAACAAKIRAGKAPRKVLLALIDEGINQSMRAAEVVRNVRDLVRGRSPERETVDLRRVIEDGARLVAGQLRQRGIELRLALHDVPMSARVGRVEIEQVVLNLLQNAIDAIVLTGEAARHHRIIVSAAQNAGGDVAEVAVRDTGIGIPPSAVERLFEPFFTTKPGGVGMGLAICRSIVEAHGGRLWVAPGEHAPGATVVRFTIPLGPAKGRPEQTRTRRDL